MSWLGDDAGQIRAIAFTCADHASVENGKAYVHGGFVNRIVVSALPGRFSLSVLAVLEVPWGHLDSSHRFVVRLEDADGASTETRIEGQFEVARSPQARVGDPAVLPLAVTFGHVPVARAGWYVFVLEVDDRPLARWSISMATAPPP